jgi:hypothetical protein
LSWSLIDASSLLHLKKERNWREKGERAMGARERGMTITICQVMGCDIHENMKEYNMD